VICVWSSETGPLVANCAHCDREILLEHKNRQEQVLKCADIEGQWGHMNKNITEQAKASAIA
jgi:hypothetical protein